MRDTLRRKCCVVGSCLIVILAFVSRMATANSIKVRVTGDFKNGVTDITVMGPPNQPVET